MLRRNAVEKLDLFLRFHKFSLRMRKRAALRWVQKVRLSNWSIVEIGWEKRPKTAKIKNSRYLSYQSTLTKAEPAGKKAPAATADLLVFLDLADHIGDAELSRFLSSIEASRILFSFSEKKDPSGRFRASALFHLMQSRLSLIPQGFPKKHREESIRALLRRNGFKHCEMRRLPLLSPASLVYAERSGALPKALR